MKCLVIPSLLVALCTSTKACTNTKGKMDCGRCSQSHVMSVANTWNSSVIVYDKPYEYVSTVLWERPCGNTYVMMYEYGDFHSFLGDYMQSLLENATLKQLQSHLNFVLIGGQKYIQQLMNNISLLDNGIGQGSLLRHFSTWLIVSSDPPPRLNVTLDNVAVIETELPEIPFNTSSLHERFNHRISEQVCFKVVHTLLWQPGGREWSRVHPCDVSRDRLRNTLFPNILKGLNGRQIIVSTLEWVPFVQRIHVDEGQIGYTGSGIEMVQLLKMKFNFSFVIVEPQDNEWGRELKNGTWTGVIGMLQKHEADMCPVLWGMSNDRRRVVDFSTPLDATPFSAVYRKDPGEVSPWSYLLALFSWEVYVCGLAAVLWCALLLQYIQRQQKTSTSHLVEYILRAPFRQDVRNVPESSSARIVLSTWCVFCMVMTVIYTGNLVAFTTVDKYKPPFTTLMELAEHDEYGLGAYDGTYIKESLTTSNCTTCKVLHAKMLESKIDGKYSTDELLRKRLAEEKFVLLVSKESEDVIRSMTCDVITMKQRLFPVHSSFIFQRNSPLRKLFDTQLAILKESAVFDKLVLKWTPPPLKCYSPDNQPWLKLDHLKASFLACATGILAATVVLLVEKYSHRCNPWA